jgi:hypothetical protein
VGLTSERLKGLTRRKLELVREIDKAPNNPALREDLALVEAEIKRERIVVVNGPEAISQKPEPEKETVRKEEAVLMREAVVSKRENAGHKGGSEGFRQSRRAGASGREKSLRDFF